MEDKDLINNVINKADVWLSGNYDQETKDQVKKMIDNPDKTELIDSFYQDLEFGTGGLRGIMGVGTNRMNKYTIGIATQGLSNYLLKEFKDLPQIKVVISYDCRNNSKYFAQITADVFTANGIKVYLFENLRPTPEVSFAIRKLECQSGVMITASHNPKEYNGYKAYWADGAQVTPPHDTNIITEVNKISNIAEVKFKGNPALLELLKEDMDNQFIDALEVALLSPESIKRHHDIGIVYSPIHGTGGQIIPKALKKYGFTNIIHVPEQDVVDGNFPTVKSPNPEDPEAMALAVKKGIEANAELLIATDPDADRYGIGVRNDNDEFVLLNGNQTMIILIYYIVTRWKELGKLTGKEYTVRTIVTSELSQVISERNGVEMFECYTGFKWIASIMRELENTRKYLGGGEESYGFLAVDFIRDKDSVSAAALFAEVTVWCKDQGKTIYQLLQDIYIEYGFSKEKGISVVKKGMSGAQEIQKMMDNFRSNPMNKLAGSDVITIKDYKTLESKNVSSAKIDKIDFPTTSNVLQYFTEDKTKVSIRPSGTEPKIKFYIETKGQLASRFQYDKVNEELEQKIDQICKDLGI